MEDNELIAKFMELDWTLQIEAPSDDYEAHELRPITVDDLQYDTSWDWLMPVISKIDVLYTKAFPADFIDRILAREDPGIDDHYMAVIALPLSTPINEAYAAIAEFIRWYNTQPPKP